ncbi:SAF domain-containing protein [Georgenia thermotolerans]|uniref:Flagellar biosynthesis protein FlgA n=1 Tax=Georgenia thermotolerans TaxID=527326 RepID=A0A7J5UKY9_9MICO|nr:SAF domain-containing protein [Georgenia thermotolerans]KAE8762533.1 flagellar biosynthesis protein FlgA [Georgenia thermotolerans]
MRTPPVPPSRSLRRRLRRGLWRGRHAIAAVSLGLAAATALEAVRPPDPPREQVLVLADDVAAGTVLAAADVTVRALPRGAAPPQALRAQSDAVGQPLAVGLPAGTALVPAMLAGPGLAAGAPPGTVVVAVPLADAASARLAQPGRRVSLVAATSDATGSPGEASVVARKVTVLAVHEDDAGGGVLAAGAPGVTAVYVAASERVATVLMGAAAWAPLRAVLEGPAGG